MKILLVAFSESIHVVRWVAQLEGLGWDVRIFPSIDHGRVHPGLSGATVYHRLSGGHENLAAKLKWQSWKLLRKGRSFLGVRFLPKLFVHRREKILGRVIAEFQPDIIHSLEFQAAGYLVAGVKRLLGARCPTWLATNWGSDIYHFVQYPEHETKIREILSNCDFYSCECQRDVCLAQAYGLKGEALPVAPNTGGFDMVETASLRQPGLTSERRLVMLKGYQHWVGRALTGLKALERCAELLADYEIVLYSTCPESIAAARKFRLTTGVALRIIASDTPHQEILRLHGHARISIGLSLSDGVSTSFLEALIMGAFPIQSWTSCADEWIVDGRTGMLVPPEDIDLVAAAIRQALTDDDLVNSAATLNYQVAQARLDKSTLTEAAIAMYTRVKNRQC